MRLLKILILFQIFLNSLIFAQESKLNRWKGANVNSLLPVSEKRHTIHTYFNTCPESPDGRYVLFFSSTDEEGHLGKICILDRQTKKETVLAENIVTEDAHRAACQQWVNNGKTVVYHNYIDKVWQVIAIDIESGKKKVLAKNRQLGFAPPEAEEVPLYGCHWNPAETRDLEFVNIHTGMIRTALTIEEVISKYSPFIKKTFKGSNISIFFPVVSPDGNKVFFKLAQGSGGDDFRSKKASYRKGKVVYDISQKKLLSLTDWGHPAWSADSCCIIEKGNFTVDINNGKSQKFCLGKNGKPGAPTNHPSMSPCGKLFITDACIDKRVPGAKGLWALVVGETKTDGEYHTIHKFQNNNGANSWRPSHPHPIFSHDGKRIYFNVSEDGFTRLYVVSLEK